MARCATEPASNNVGKCCEVAGKLP